MNDASVPPSDTFADQQFAAEAKAPLARWITPNPLMADAVQTLGTDGFSCRAAAPAPSSEPLYQAVYQRQAGGFIRALPAAQANLIDPAHLQGCQGGAARDRARDWPLPGQAHERIGAWRDRIAVDIQANAKEPADGQPNESSNNPVGKDGNMIPASGQ